jgi:endogenous inhibitor of DNA gyrase (YacG/DUF329 family)
MGREPFEMSASVSSPRRHEKPAPKACPICGKPRDPGYDPFCSKRCADIDLHHWLKGSYVIPGAERSAESDWSDNEEE